MKKIKQPKAYSVWGAFALLFCVGFTTTCSVLLYDKLSQQYPDNNAFTAIFLLINIVFISILYGFADYFRRKLTVSKPLIRILEATEKITSGDFNVELQPLHAYGMYDEFDLITENINRMASELKKNEVLKTDFIANVSHEIKTPIAIISNYATLLQDKNLTQEQVEEYAKILQKTSKRLSDLVMNILKLNKLDNQRISEPKTEIRLHDKLGESILTFEDLMNEKEIELDLNIDEITIFAEKTYLDIIFNNLVSNAVKFSNQNGKITISLKDKESFVELKVQDEGLGMTKEVGARIFDKFYQGDTSHSSEGNGLGLALVKKVIDIMGGEIFVESQLNKGSTFIVKIRKENER